MADEVGLRKIPIQVQAGFAHRPRKGRDRFVADHRVNIQNGEGHAIEVGADEKGCQTHSKPVGMLPFIDNIAVVNLEDPAPYLLWEIGNICSLGSALALVSLLWWICVLFWTPARYTVCRRQSCRTTAACAVLHVELYGTAHNFGEALRSN